MILDGIEQRYHVRERDNRVAVILYKPGWACVDGADFWYLGIEDLKNSEWKHRRGSSVGGLRIREALDLAESTYDRLAKETK